MAEGKTSIGKIIGWSLVAIAVIVIIIGVATPDAWLRKLWAKWFPPSNEPSGRRTINGNPDSRARYEEIVRDTIADDYNTYNRCVLRDERGHLITITADENSEVFNRICRGGQPYYYNTFWYYPIFFRPHPKPKPPTPPAPTPTP